MWFSIPGVRTNTYAKGSPTHAYIHYHRFLMMFNKSENILPSEIHQLVLSPFLFDQCVQVESHYYLLALVK